jgi:hypothetical protein
VAQTPVEFDLDFTAKIGRPPRRQPRKKIEGETKMKVKSSRGIVMKLICCTAMVVLASAVALSQTPTSGALLTITNGSSVNLKIYDSQIHTGTVRTVPLTPTNGSSCPSTDLIPTDAYVLQGGAPTGCDPGDPFETGNGAGVTGTATLGNFTITTQYLCASTGCGASDTTICETSGNSGGVCIGGGNLSVDTGFLTVKNNGADFTGTITLTGTSPTTGGSFCPASQPGTDTFTGLVASGASRTFALSADSSNCGGFNAAQTLNLTANQESKAFFGKDDYKITPLNSAAGAKLDVLPVPVPAGPTGIETNPATSTLTFSPGTTFPSLKCIPYADFSAPNNPVCVELQLSPNDGGNYLYTATNDFNIDINSLPNGVGGPSFLGHHSVPCPDSGFNINIFFSYTAPSVTNGDPLKGGGSGTGSCWVTAFDPNAGAISTGTTFSFFVGFQSPVSDTDLNLVKPGQSVALIFQLFSSPGVGNPNYSLCPGQVVPTSNLCPSTNATTNWVFFGTVKTACMNDPTPNDDTLDTVAAGSSALQNFGNGTYQYNLKTVKGSTGCFDAVLIFDSGLTLFPANFKYKQ